MMIDVLPEYGWGVLRNVPFHLVLAYHGAGYIKVQITATPNVYQARLTGAGRRYRQAQGAGAAGDSRGRLFS